jgi:hypothetical protein
VHESLNKGAECTGYTTVLKLMLEQLVELRIHGIDANYIHSLSRNKKADKAE